MFTTIITDCRDDNARARQESRIAALCQTSTSFIGVQSDIEASLHLIDILDATEGRPGIILVNVAPRGGHTRAWENGTPFAFFWHQETLVVASIDGFTLAAVKKLQLVNTVQQLDTRSAAAAMAAATFISADAAAHIPETQFRSFDFTPRAAAFLYQKQTLPSTTLSLTDVPDLPAAIWHIDSFGNAKTTLTPNEISTSDLTPTRFGTLAYYDQLRSVPDNESALVRGSSGMGTTRFLEGMMQRGNFANAHHAQIGDDIFSPTNHAQHATT